MDYKLTKEADALLCILYASYKEKVQTMPRDKARMCGGLEQIQQLVSSEFHIEDTKDLCYELEHNGLLDCLHADNIPYIVKITSDAISYMESRNKKDIKKIIDKCFSVIPDIIKLFLS